MNESNENNWRDLYRAAVLEFNSSLFQVRVNEALAAINARASDGHWVPRDDIRDEDGNTALIDATQDSNVVLILLQGGAKINAQNKVGQTALINCANPKVAWVLLANHADASIRDANGKTALDLARQYQLLEKEEVLVSGKEPRAR